MEPDRQPGAWERFVSDMKRSFVQCILGLPSLFLTLFAYDPWMTFATPHLAGMLGLDQADGAAKILLLVMTLVVWHFTLMLVDRLFGTKLSNFRVN